MNRRELMRLFGVGAVVAPVVKGVALASEHALIVAPPQVEIAKPPQVEQVNSIPSEFMGIHKLEVAVFIRSKQTGDVTRMDCEAFMTRHEMSINSMASWDNPYRSACAPFLHTCTFEASGPMRIIRQR